MKRTVGEMEGAWERLTGWWLRVQEMVNVGKGATEWIRNMEVVKGNGMGPPGASPCLSLTHLPVGTPCLASLPLLLLCCF